MLLGFVFFSSSKRKGSRDRGSLSSRTTIVNVQPEPEWVQIKAYSHWPSQSASLNQIKNQGQDLKGAARRLSPSDPTELIRKEEGVNQCLMTELASSLFALTFRKVNRNLLSFLVSDVRQTPCLPFPITIAKQYFFHQMLFLFLQGKKQSDRVKKSKISFCFFFCLSDQCLSVTQKKWSLVCDSFIQFGNVFQQWHKRLIFLY